LYSWRTASQLKTDQITAREISRELRESWPAVARPETMGFLGSSSNAEVVFEDQPRLANTANVG
jgi:hypothetical protein